MVVEMLVTAVAAVLVFELFEHVIIPLVAVRAGRGGQPLTGAEGMVGRRAVVKRWAGGEGTVLVNGELWRAESRSALEVGDTVAVVGVGQLTLQVELQQEREPPAPQSSSPDGPPRRLASPPTTRVPSSTQRR